MIQSKLSIILSLCVIAVVTFNGSLAKPMSTSQQEEPVIPSPNQEFGDEESANSRSDIQRRTDTNSAAATETIVPIYVSPYLRPERDAQQSAVAPRFDSPVESVEPSVRSVAQKVAPSGINSRDLKAAASYGHGHHGSGHHGSYGDDHHGHGWLDMGAWTGGKGSFGWYADYPVGSKHGAHY